MKEKFTPKGRKENLVVQELEGEVLIYDLEKNKAFCLNETSALVWQSCDGSRTIADITDAVGKQLSSQINEDLVWLALDQLSRENLIENKTEVKNKFAGLSRREAVRKVGLASLVALPVIASLTAPVAAQTGTCPPPLNLPNGSTCGRSCVCSSGCCRQNGNTGNGLNTCLTSGPGIQCYPA
ncbi:MAG TPA: PqqD family protein [Pyrinomonadaceae bacterium]|jgi:hypothetical protein